ncbi:hypothetical protein A7312_26750 [Paenibacillus polymyxa]|uniref:Uncharacterized protein n=1 Tax=Paenibacillus polymyxa TaxID=1406 RepID=A0ABX2ZFC0_PAEPO|nr:hypothetical protein A7312_26750 [Paenibacillus polymyxa]
MSGLEKYVEDKEDRFSTKWFNDHLSRGHIVEVELFGHVNKELTFAHPCVVLFDGSYSNESGGWMLVAPISTPRYQDGGDFTVDITELDGIKHNSGVCIDAIQVIDKRRVLYQHELADKNKSKIRTEKLDEIDFSILKYYLPKLNEKLLDIEQELAQEKLAHEQTKEELIELRKINKELEEKSILMKQELESTQ